MDKFVEKIKLYNSSIQPSDKVDFTNSHIKNKQLVIYYLYRILCKYKDAFKLAIDESILNEIFNIIGVSNNLCYPLGNKITNNETIIENIIEKILEIFLTYHNKNISSQNSSVIKLNKFINYKLTDDTMIIKDLARINMLVPNLAISEKKPSYEEINNSM